jgi:monofunctional biosynthetic peptidoglycan transglycosylase
LTTGVGPRSRSRRRRVRRLMVAVVAVGLLVLAGWAAWTVVTLPDVGILARQRPATTAFMQRYLSEQKQAGHSTDLLWHWVPYAEISAHLKRAVLVAEDINYFSHAGFDGHEIGEALREAWHEKDAPRGASTITQQLARNLYLSPARTPWRKLEEALLTRRLEARLGKRRILEIYLNVVEFGPGIYGAEAASRHYFGIAAADLDEHQAAELAAVLPRPSLWHPGRDTPGYQAAVERILRRMEKAEFLWRLI